MVDYHRLKIEFLRKFNEKNIISGFSAPFIFESGGVLQEVIHKLKYDKRYQYGLFLGREIGSHLFDLISGWNADFLVPIPLYHTKMAERGYNQSYYIAKGISNITNTRINTSIVKRVKYTISQTSLDIKEREKNVENVFICKKGKLSGGENLILVDDVSTTGATLNECGKVLKLSGAGNIFGLTAALAD